MARYTTFNPATLAVILARVAAQCRRTGLTTVEARLDALRQAGVNPRPARQALEEEIARQKRARDKRFVRRAVDRQAFQAADYRFGSRHGYGHQRGDVLGGECCPAAMEQSRSLVERLTQIRQNAVAGLYRCTYRCGAAGGSSIRVGLTTDPDHVGAHVTMTTNRTTYRGSYKGWTANEDHHLVTVPVDWRIRVQRQGLDRLGGMLTLDAQRLDVDAGQGIEMWAATWVEQGRAYTVHTRSGVIAIRRMGNSITHEYHGADVRRALIGLRRKVAGISPTATPPDLDRLAARRGEEWVPVAVARATGACEYGIRSWCQRVGLAGAYAAGGCTLAELIAGYRESPVVEARATILRAMRRKQEVAA